MPSLSSSSHTESLEKHVGPSFLTLNTRLSITCPDFLDMLSHKNSRFQLHFRRFGEFMQCFLKDSSNVVATFIDVITKRLDKEVAEFTMKLKVLLTNTKTKALSLRGIGSISLTSLEVFTSSVLRNLLLFFNSLLVNVFLERRDQINRCSDMVILSELKFVKDLQSLFALLPLIVSKSSKFLKKWLPLVVSEHLPTKSQFPKMDLLVLKNAIDSHVVKVKSGIEEKVKCFSSFALFLPRKFEGRFKELREKAVLPSFEGMVQSGFALDLVNKVYEAVEGTSEEGPDLLKNQLVGLFGKFFFEYQ